MPGRRTAAIFYVCFFGFLAVAACQRAQAATLTPLDAAIAVAGNRHVEAQMIRSHFRASADGRLDAAALDAALKSLYATGLFADVKISREHDHVLVTVVENPTIQRLAFEGNKKIKDDDLKKALQSKAGGPLARAIVHGDVERIIELYRQRGYFNVRVDPKTINAKNERVDLVFEIKEGDKLAVRQILFVGNSAYPQNKLKGVIKTGETNFLSFLLDNDAYDADRESKYFGYSTRSPSQKFALRRCGLTLRGWSTSEMHDNLWLPIGPGRQPIPDIAAETQHLRRHSRASSRW